MYNRVYNTKSVVEAGIITGIIVLLALMNIYMPIFSIFGRFILPIPVVVLMLRHNLKVTITSIVVSGILVGIMYNPLSGISSSIMYGLTGISLGYCIKKDKEVAVSILILSVSSLVGSIIDMIIYISIISKGTLIEFIDEMIKVMNESMELTLSMYSRMGVSEEQLKPLIESFQIMNSDFLLKVIPGMVILSSVILAYVTYIITRSILKRLNYNIKEMPKISHIHVNIKVATFTAIGLLIGVLLVRQNIKAGEYILNSSQILLQYLFLFSGVSVAIYYLRYKYKLSKGISSLIIIFTVFSQLAFIYTILGISDIIIDLRKLDAERVVNTNRED